MTASLTRFSVVIAKARYHPLARFVLQWLRSFPFFTSRIVQRPFIADENFRQMTFTFALIALAAKIATIDGPMKKEAFATFMKLFPMPHTEQSKVHRLFTMACSDPSDAGHYARQIASLFPGCFSMLQDMVVKLCRVASADGPATQIAKQQLETIATIVGVRKEIVRASFAPRLPVSPGDPYKVLGISRRSSNSDIKKTYYDRIRKIHPDRMMAEGRGATDIADADAMLAALNDAYSTLVRKRKMK